MSIIRNGLESADLDVPVVLPTLNLDFANSQQLDPRITFTRGSIGTFVNKNGLIETAAVNQPRFDYDPISGECRGLLIEESRENLVINSETLSNYSNVRMTNNTVTTGGPFGTGYHEKTVTVNQIAAGAYIFNFSNLTSISLTAGQTVTFSIFFKNISVNSNQIFLRFWSGDGRAWTTQRQVRYDLSSLTAINSTGTIVNKSIQAFPDGWYRLSMTATADRNGFSAESVLIGGTLNIGDKYQIIGAQLEVGAFPTSYIPTFGSTFTRSADLASMTGTNFSSWYNQTEGTVFTSYQQNSNATGLNFGVFSLTSSTSNSNNLIDYFIGSGVSSVLRITFGGVIDQVYEFGGTSTANVRNKGVFSFTRNRFTKCINGIFYSTSLVRPITSGIQIPTVNTLVLGQYWGGVTQLNGTISRLTYYPKALSPSQLQYLTQ